MSFLATQHKLQVSLRNSPKAKVAALLKKIEKNRAEDKKRAKKNRVTINSNTVHLIENWKAHELY